MGSNKVVTVALLDVCKSMSSSSDEAGTFFDRSLNCLRRMMLRKMFSQDNDEMGIILFGTDDTDNQLARGLLYQNISIFSKINLPTWKLYRQLDNILISSRAKSDWIEPLIVALDFLKDETQGRKFKHKQIILFSNLSADMPVSEDHLTPVLNVLNGEDIQLIFVCNDMELECSQSSRSNSCQVILKTIASLESGVQFSFKDIEYDLQYFEKKRKMPRLYKINFNIGAKIQLPVRWMKVTHEETLFKWDFPPQSPMLLTESGVNRKPGQSSFSLAQTSDNYQVEFVTDMVKKTNFGASIIDLGYADLEAMKRKTGSPSFYYIGSIKSSKVPRSMFVSKDVYVVVADKDARSVSMFSAFVDALEKAGKYGIARRISTKNGKINIGALLPVSDELGKALYFLKLPFADWVKKVPEVHLPEAKEKAAQTAMSDLIEGSMLSEDLIEDGKGLLVRDPTFQSRCHLLSLRATGRLPKGSLPPEQPPTIVKILNPVEPSKKAIQALKELEQLFPYVPHESKPAKPGIPRPNFMDRKDEKVIDNQVVKKEPCHSVSPSATVKKELDNIIELANMEYDTVFSEELFPVKNE